MKTLILNRDWTVLQTCTWEKAISLLYIKKVAVQADFYKDFKIRAGKTSYPVPAVIVLNKYVRHDYVNKKKYSRSAVLKRDNYTCQYCGYHGKGSDLTIDHVIPKSKYVGDDVTNFLNCVCACKPCNAKKSDKTCDKFGKYPTNKPIKPTYIDLVLSDMKHIPNEWIPYLKNSAYFKHYVATTSEIPSV